MTKSLKEFQQRLLQMLLVLDKFMQDNNLDYFLIGGSALGAVRHQGFIPWDDDIDIGLSREEFERFESLDFSPLEAAGLKYCKIGQNIILNAPIGYLYDRSDPSIPVEECPTIDIFPIDKVPDSGFKRRLQKFFSFVYHLAIGRTPAKNRGKKAYVFTKIIVSITPGFMFRFYEKVAKRAMLAMGKGKSSCVANIFGMKKYYREIMPAQYVAKTLRVPFEGHMLPIPEMYHEYLAHLFGNYMQLPPIEQQKPHHKYFD